MKLKRFGLRFLYGCERGCDPANCRVTGSGPFGSCQQIRVTANTSVYARAVRGSDADDMPTWELTVIIACSTGGGIFVALVLFTIVFLVYRSSKRRSYESLNAQHP
jgi:hypothetical protein